MENHNLGSLSPQNCVVYMIVVFSSLSKNCGRGWDCGCQNLKIVVEVVVGVVIFGKIVLLWLWCSLFKHFGCGWVVFDLI